MTPQELKNSILQRAIQGKLVEQRPEEGTAEELYRQIQAEKQALIKAEKIKKEKPLPEIAEEEKPFDIPESWKWVTLSQITSELSLNDGNWVLSDDMVTLGAVKLIQLGSIGNCKYVEKGFKYLTEEHFSELNGRQIFEGYLLINRLIGDRMLCCILPQIGGILGTAVDVCWIAPSKYYESKYLMYMLASPMFQSEVKSVGAGTTRFRVSKGNLIKLYFPLPPLAEQKRIVAKIEELLPLIDRYEEARTKLEEFNKRFPGNMQKSLLQMAIQGKLVEQRPEEGTGEELYQQIQSEKQVLIKAKAISKGKTLETVPIEDMPFDIPDSWKWIRLGDVLTSTDAGKSPQCENRPRQGDEWGVIKTTAVQDGYFLPEENKVLPSSFIVQDNQIVHSGDFLITRAGPKNRTGIMCVVKEEPTNLILSDKTVRLSYIRGYVDPDYLREALASPATQYWVVESMTGMAASQVNISQDKMRTFILPLPPLAEQKRIVAKLEELLPLCERLK